MVKKITTTIYKDEENNFEYTFEPIDDTFIIEPTKDGFSVKYLTRDKDPISPDEWLDNEPAAFLVHYHRDFWIEHALCPKDTLGYIYTGNDAEYNKDGAKALLKDYYVLPVDAYIHSGVSLSLSGGFAGKLPQGHEQFDVSRVGAILVKKREFGSGGVEFQHNKDEARTIAEGVLQGWNEYLSGDVYCIVCEKYDKDKEPFDYDVVCGFYGFDYAKECLKTEI